MIRVSYTLRDLDGSVDNAIQPVALQFRVGSTGPFTNVPAGFVPDATTGPSLAVPRDAGQRRAAGGGRGSGASCRSASSPPTRSATTSGWAIDDITVTAGGGPPQPSLSVRDVSVTEGDTGVVNAHVLVRLTSPAGPGGVTFDVATADGTAFAATSDYVPVAGSLTIAEGTSETAVDVSVVGDTFIEPNETFAVVVGNVAGAVVADDTGVVTIVNDDVQLTTIHEIQGAGATSPLAGATVSTRGVVTALKSNGFFLQTPDADADTDPQTSEGIIVFTGSTLPAGRGRGGAAAGHGDGAGVRAGRGPGAAADHRAGRRR